MPKLGKILQCEQEIGNLEDSYAVSVMKADTIVGHVPREKSRVVWCFIEHDIVVTHTLSSFLTIVYRAPVLHPP